GLVEGVDPWTRQRQRSHGPEQREVELIAALAHPKASRQMDGHDRDEHGTGDGKAAERREKSEREQDAAPEFSERRDPCPWLGRPDAELLNHLGPAIHAGTAPPTEQLLSAVPGQDEAYHESKNQESKCCHIDPPDLVEYAITLHRRSRNVPKLPE